LVLDSDRVEYRPGRSICSYMCRSKHTLFLSCSFHFAAETQTSGAVVSWYSDGSSWYAIVGKSGVYSWFDAEEKCRKLTSPAVDSSSRMTTSYGRLVTISSASQMITLSTRLSELSPVRSGYWIGGRSVLTPWTWSDGTSLGDYCRSFL